VDRELSLDVSKTPARIIGKADHVGRRVKALLGGLESGSAGFDRHWESDTNFWTRIGKWDMKENPQGFPSGSLSGKRKGFIENWILHATPGGIKTKQWPGEPRPTPPR
jgi:hypothetical protein